MTPENCAFVTVLGDHSPNPADRIAVVFDLAPEPVRGREPCARPAHGTRRIALRDLGEDRRVVTVEEAVEPFELGGVHAVTHVKPRRSADCPIASTSRSIEP
jgi:hypothetical protein